MALIKNSVFHGIELQDAVFTVETVTISSQLDFTVSMRASSDGERLSMSHHGCAYDASAGDPFTQAYAYLKSLDEFSNATEV